MVQFYIKLFMKTVSIHLFIFGKAFSFVCCGSSLSSFQEVVNPFSLSEYLFMSFIFIWQPEKQVWYIITYEYLPVIRHFLCKVQLNTSIFNFSQSSAEHDESWNNVFQESICMCIKVKIFHDKYRKLPMREMQFLEWKWNPANKLQCSCIISAQSFHFWGCLCSQRQFLKLFGKNFNNIIRKIGFIITPTDIQKKNPYKNSS